MMDTVIPFALLCFTSLFTITSPLSTMPVFLTMTQSLDEKERRAVAIRATLVACCALLLFVLAGQFLFKFFGISTNGFRIVGGIIIFRIGFDMLQAKYTPMNLRKEEIKEYANDVSVAPLGIPLLCGPGPYAPLWWLVVHCCCLYWQVSSYSSFLVFPPTVSALWVELLFFVSVSTCCKPSTLR
ncbi:MarC family protein [Paraprevotella clara]|uniref:MarC family protein n=1 Tax=Paraprevotella clara TaxID=454154 RepID=UPI003C6DD818